RVDRHADGAADLVRQGMVLADVPQVERHGPGLGAIDAGDDHVELNLHHAVHVHGVDDAARGENALGGPHDQVDVLAGAGVAFDDNGSQRARATHTRHRQVRLRRNPLKEVAQVLHVKFDGDVEGLDGVVDGGELEVRSPDAAPGQEDPAWV